MFQIIYSERAVVRRYWEVSACATGRCRRPCQVRGRYARYPRSREGVRELERQLRDTVDEVASVCAGEASTTSVFVPAYCRVSWRGEAWPYPPEGPA